MVYLVTLSVTPNDKMINEYLLGVNMEGRGHDVNWGENPGIRLEGLRETTKTLSQNSRSPDRDSSPRLQQSAKHWTATFGPASEATSCRAYSYRAVVPVPDTRENWRSVLASHLDIVR
jgi:hypothetical protein